MEKKGTPGTTVDSTNAHSETGVSPFMARRREETKRSAAAAMERVAEPAPSLAFTTSSPPNWMRLVSASSCSLVNLAPGT